MRRTRLPRISLTDRQTALSLDHAAVRRLVREAAPRTFCASRVTFPEISLVFVSDEEIAELNERFLGHRGPTDVISFEHGEIVISTHRAIAQAKRFRTAVHDELALYLIHGLLHLAGHDDIKPAGRRSMDRLQRGILRVLRKELDLRRLLR